MAHRLTREDLEAREDAWLAPYAMRSRDTRGRRYPEPEDAYRTVYRRDHDRIIHTSAFRRLEYKTQVFVNDAGDYYRTRLTHTLEVAQLAVSIARALRLNEDLVEVVCLAHDIGHPPFGHAGEDALREVMRGYGGFEHNLQGLRIVELLEARYPSFTGLNLTWELRESMNKHKAPKGSCGLDDLIQPIGAPLLEAQVADLADELAYDNHDVDDGLTSGILKEEMFAATELWQQAQHSVDAAGPIENAEIRKYQQIRAMINAQVTDAIQATAERLEACGVVTLEDVRAAEESWVGFSASMARMRKPLKQVLFDRFYHDVRVLAMAEKARTVIQALFEYYLANKEDLPNTTRLRIEHGEEAHRVVCDYIAGMTDRYCIEKYHEKINASAC